jgi:hypothetical protein
MTVIEMSERELSRLRVLIDLSDRRLTVEAAGTLMGLGRRQMYRLRRTFATDGPTAVVSRKRGRPSNHRHGETFRRTVLALVHEHYSDFGPTLAAEKLAARHELCVGVETLRQWMMADGLWGRCRPGDCRSMIASSRFSSGDCNHDGVAWCRSLPKVGQATRRWSTMITAPHSIA